MDGRKKCSLRGLVLSCASALSRHKLNIHRDIKFTCETCGKKYSRQDTVKYHVCKQKMTLKCDNCDMSFKYLSYKKRHNCRKEGKRWYLVKWKPKWVKKHQLPEGVFEKWEEKKAKRAKILAENPDAEPEPEEEETGFRILEERRVIPGQEPEDDEKNGDEEEEGEEGEEDDEEGLDEEDEEGMDEEEDEKFDPDTIKEEPEDDEYHGENGLNVSDDEELNGLSSIDRDIVLNELPGEGEIKQEGDIKEEEDEDKISIPTDYSKPYS